jgi:hypothetical protein
MWLFGSLNVIGDEKKGAEKAELERVVAEVGKIIQREVEGMET